MKQGSGGGAYAPAVNRRRHTVKRLPKLSIAAFCACHLILAARATTGAGGDCLFFEPLLLDAWRRAKVKVAVAARLSSPKSDAGFDSEANHCIARQDLGVRSIIPPNVGRPTSKPPTTRHRRNMRRRFNRKADKKHYGQRCFGRHAGVGDARLRPRRQYAHYAAGDDADEHKPPQRRGHKATFFREGTGADRER